MKIIIYYQEIWHGSNIVTYVKTGELIEEDKK